MVDSPCPFAVSLLVPSDVAPAELPYAPPQILVRVTGPGSWISGPLDVVGEWVVTNGGVPANPTTVAVIAGKIHVQNPAWGGFTLATLTYAPGPVPFVNNMGQRLAAFSLPLPFP